MDSLSHASQPIVAVASLMRRFGTKTALDNVSLTVPRGRVFGLVGENGAGKSTLIKHILGMWRPESGTVRVFGLDPTADPVSVLRRIGYLSEQPDLPDWMRVHEFLRYMRAFYPNWDDGYADALRLQFQLEPMSRLRVLSKGQRAKLGLLAAQAHRPELLLLDEPSSGLDPIVRSDILEAIIRTIADEGRTVFFSSHLLEEIERVSDDIAMLHRGKLVLCGPLEEIKTQHRRATVFFEKPQTKTPVIRGALAMTGSGREWTVIYKRSPVGASDLSVAGGTIVEEEAASLSEIFVAYAGTALQVPFLVPAHV